MSAKYLSAKGQLATLTAPLRSAAGWAFVKWTLLSRLARRYVALRSCMLEIRETPEARSPLFSACITDALMHVVPSKRECHIRVDGHRVVIQWNSEKEMRACRAAFEFSNRKIEDHYKIVAHRQLGRGRSSEVVFAFDIRTGEHAAVKVVGKDSSRIVDRIFAEKEVSIRMSVRHACIVQTLDIFESPYDLFLVMEFMDGGTLTRRMAKRGAPLTEDEARHVMKNLLSALRYLHGRGIVHRNVKPETLLLDYTDEMKWAETVKLADFSLACTLDDPDAAFTVVGTPEYLAPEAATMVGGPGGYRRIIFGTEMDMWAAGVSLYNMLSQELPFDGKTPREILQKSRAGEIEFPARRFSNISTDAQSLIRSLVNTDRRKRLTAQTAMEHSWFHPDADGNLSKKRSTFPRPRVGYPMFRAAATIVFVIGHLSRGVRNKQKQSASFGIKEIQSHIGGVNILPGQGNRNFSKSLSASRISSTSTVHSRSSLGEDPMRRIELSPLLGTRDVVSRVIKGDESPEASPSWATGHIEAFTRGLSNAFRSDPTSKRASLSREAKFLEHRDRAAKAEHRFGSNPALRLRTARRTPPVSSVQYWEQMDAKSERLLWRSREGVEKIAAPTTRVLR